MKKNLTKLTMLLVLFLGLWQHGFSQCTVDAGTISTTDPTTICVDGIPDPINVTVVGSTGSDAAWIITDGSNNILATPPGGPFDLDGAGPGVCLIWYIRHDGTLAGNVVGNNITDFTGCFDLSNEITVTRNEPQGGTLAGGPYEFCVDGLADNIPAGAVTVSGNTGETSQWVVTDDQRNILGLPPSPDVVNFDGAGGGMCYIYNVSYYGTLTGLAMGSNLDDVMGCFSESDNFITVVRNEPMGGTLAGGPYEFCVDGVADNIPAGAVTVSGNTGETSQWVVTDDQRNILGLPPSPDIVNFDGAGGGMCYIYNVSYYGTLTGLAMGSNLDDVMGCYSESDNFITVVRNEPMGGTLAGGPYEFCVDGEADNISVGAVTVSGNTGEISQWVVTDDQRNILGLPPSPDVVNFDGAGGGMCYIYNVSYFGTLTGLAMGSNLDDVMGCYSESDNFITVVRNEPIGGTLAGGPYEFCVDGEADNIPAGAVTVSGNTGETSQWVVTDDQRNILGLPPSPDVVNFDGAGGGMCYIYNVSYYGTLTGLAMGSNLDDVMGCFSESDNFITVVRNEPDGGTLSTENDTIICVDGIADPIDVSVEGAVGPDAQWIITNDTFEILAKPAGPPFNLDGAGPGTCLIWYVRSYGTIEGDTVGGELEEMLGCFDLSDSIAVVRNEPLGGMLAGGPFEFCVGDGEEDNIPTGAVTVSGNEGETSQWVVTDDQRNILGLPPSPDVVNFDVAGGGMCYIYNVSYYGEVTGLAMGMNLDNVSGCVSESDNFITVVRNGVNGGSLLGGPFVFCVGDGVEDNIPTGAVSVIGNEGETSQWVVTDDQRNILGLPPSPDVVNFDGAGGGMCYIFNVSYNGQLTGLAMGMNLDNVQGCFSESDNFITVVRNEPQGGMLSGGPFEFCVGDGEDDNIPAGGVTVSGNEGATSQWVVTDDQRNILGLPPNPEAVNFDGAGPGMCYIFNVSYFGQLTGLEMGMNLDDVEGCLSESENFVTVVRNSPVGGTLAGGPYEFCIDGQADNIPVGGVTVSGNIGENSQWVITDDQMNILGLPPSPDVVNFDGAGVGQCYIFNLSSYGPITGLEMGMNLNDIEGCASVSDNFITVTRDVIDGGEISLANGETIYANCPGQVVFDVENTSINQLFGYYYLITDINDNILEVVNSSNTNTLDLSAAPAGECHVWGWNAVSGNLPSAGTNINELGGADCTELSENSIVVLRTLPDGGEIALDSGATEYEGCAGEIDFDLTFETSTFHNYWFVVTDDNSNILTWFNSDNGGWIDLNNAPPGVCRIYGWSEMDETEPTIGAPISSLDQLYCGDVSDNWVTITRLDCNANCTAEAAEISTIDDTSICVDGNPDPINVSVDGGAGINSAWVITDTEGNILGLPTAGPFDLDGAGEGTCLIWYLTFDEVSGAELGLNANDLTGCFALSNPITVTREAANGGLVSLTDGTTTYSNCAGDVVFDVTHTTTALNLSYWYIITDADDNILDFHNSADGPTLDLSGAPAGECHIWGWSYSGESDPIMGENISTLTDGDCEAISDNFITINREIPDGGTVILAGGGEEYSNCAGQIVFDVEHTTTAPNLSYWYIITDADDNILAFHNSADGPTLDLSGAPAGECHVWGWNYRGLDDPIMGENISTLTDDFCEAISDNFITVHREIPDGGAVMLAGGGEEYSNCAGQIVFDVEHTTTAPNLSYWYIITDADDNILAFHNSADGPTLDLSGAPAGECHVWGWNYRGLGDPIMGENILTLTDDFCEAISDNFITVNREVPDGGTVMLAGGGEEYSNCAGQIVFDVEHTTTAPKLSYWYIITDADDNILAFHNSADGSTLDLSGAPAGECHVWGWNYRGLDDPIMGENISTLTDDFCEAISDNFITVNREIPDGGMVLLADGTDEGVFVAGDVVFDVQHSTTAPNLSYWYIITDAEDNILAFHNSADGPTLNLSGAPIGECHVWGWNYRGLDDPTVGENISTLTDDFCEAISDNFITITRTEGLAAAVISTEDETTICVDGNADPINIIVTGGQGSNSAYVITDIDGTILGLPPMGPFDLDGAGEGVCLIWHLNYETIGGLEMGMNANDLTGEFALSNAITVTRQAANGGIVALTSGQDTATYCVGDVIFDVQHETTATALSYWYIITDAEDNILAYHNSADGPTLDLSGAPAGECHVWGWSYRGEPNPVMGENISTLSDGDCEAISDNFITITRAEGVTGGTIATEDSVIACPGDGDDDVVNLTTTGGGDGYAYILTDEDDVIMGQMSSTPAFNFESMEPGIVKIYGLGYAGTISIGNTIDDINGNCAVVSDNFIEITIQETAACATTSTNDEFVGSVAVYPNPAVSFITVEYNELVSASTVNIIDVQGRRVHNQPLTGENGKTRIDVSNITGGVYLVQIISDSNVMTKKIIITK